MWIYPYSSWLLYWHWCNHINELFQERCNSTANALELHLSCINPSICSARPSVDTVLTKKLDMLLLLLLLPMISIPYIFADLTSLTHWGRDKFAVILPTTFSNAFSWMKMYEFCFKISLKFFPKVRINKIPALFQIMAWHQTGYKPLSETMMIS